MPSSPEGPFFPLAPVVQLGPSVTGRCCFETKSPQVRMGLPGSPSSSCLLGVVSSEPEPRLRPTQGSGWFRDRERIGVVGPVFWLVRMCDLGLIRLPPSSSSPIAAHFRGPEGLICFRGTGTQFRELVIGDELGEDLSHPSPKGVKL